MATKTDPQLASNLNFAQDELFIFSITYQQLEIAAREKLAMDQNQLAELANRFHQTAEINEICIISTCNRLEIVASIIDPKVVDSICDLFQKLVKHQPQIFHQQAAITHLFRVIAGLDSMILGEPEIIGQVKDAYLAAKKLQYTGAHLNRVFQSAFRLAKRVRTETKLGQRSLSFGYIARELSEQIFGDLKETSILLLGTGEIGRTTIRHFLSRGVKAIYIANRTVEKAATLAGELQGMAVGLDQLESILPKVDIIIGASSRSATNPYLISHRDGELSSDLRAGRPQLLIDLGVPRNFEESLHTLPETYLYNLDDLGKIATSNRNVRAAEIDSVNALIAEETTRYERWRYGRSREEQITQAMKRLEELRAQEIEKTLKRLQRGDLTANELHAALEDLTKSLLTKTLHRSLVEVRESSDEQILEVFQRFFS
jgi:glutamyl-tRNA reductase